jgi:hypothetical protein
LIEVLMFPNNLLTNVSMEPGASILKYTNSATVRTDAEGFYET